MTKPLKPTLLLDVEKYQHMLDDSDLSETEKREFLQILWNMVCEFVALGFGVHPLQQLSGDQSQKSPEIQAFLNKDVVECLDPEILEDVASQHDGKE